MISYMPMAMKCMYCGKGIMYGHNVSHSKRRTPRTFKPNLHNARVKTTTGYVRLKLCTKCLRILKKIQLEKPVEIPAEESTQVAA
jgi:large subunit ribosomal protein L28